MTPIPLERRPTFLAEFVFNVDDLDADLRLMDEQAAAKGVKEESTVGSLRLWAVITGGLSRACALMRRLPSYALQMHLMLNVSDSNRALQPCSRHRLEKNASHGAKHASITRRH